LRNLYILGLLTLFSLWGCRRDADDDNQLYDPNGTEFRFGYNNAAVRFHEFKPAKRIIAPSGNGPQVIADSLDLDNDFIPDIVLVVNYGKVPAASIEFGSLGLESTSGLYQFASKGVLLDSIYKCLDGNDTFVYNAASNYACQNFQFASITPIKQSKSYVFGEMPLDPNIDPNLNWDYESIPLSQYNQGYSTNYQSDYRFENHLVPNNQDLYIHIQNRLTKQNGWIHLRTIDHAELQVFDYALEKLF